MARASLRCGGQALFFISFYLLVSLLFVQTFIGVVLEYSKVRPIGRSARVSVARRQDVFAELESAQKWHESQMRRSRLSLIA